MNKNNTIVLLCTILLAGCATAIARNPVPQYLVEKAHISGFKDIRFWGDKKPDNILELIQTKFSQMQRHRPNAYRNGVTVNYLAISGGADDGAFGAGFLYGWSLRGTRPQFEIVTGVSTGALAAPFAFLGSRYDRTLKEIYTSYSTKDLVTTKVLSGLLGGSSLADNAGMVRLIAKYITPKVLREIAVEHRKGRRLLVGTTNLDAQRAVIWDLGAIAASGHPKSLHLFRKVLEASAALPGIFPPVIINVSADGSKKDELHIDGGPTAEVFFLPMQFINGAGRVVSRTQPTMNRKLYIIRNSRLSPEWKPVQPKTMEIAGRSISTLIKNQGIGDLYQLYVATKKHSISFNLAAIPKEFKGKSTESFDKKYMNQLFNYASKMAGQGYSWMRVPPGLE